jgi:hypothetical protein
MSLEFEWDPSKARENARKHAVTFEEALTIFGDPLASSIHDPVPSLEEERFISVRQSDRGRLLVVAFTDREQRIRIISARVASRRERKQYEKGIEGEA